jgi:hypothetical protein
MGFKQQFFNVVTEDGRNFVLREPVDYVTAAGEVITIPAGAESDGASTPAAIWPTIPPFGSYWRAAYLHDYLYRYTQRPKSECDSLLLEAMLSCGVGEIEARLIYEGVNIGGNDAFNSDRLNQAKLTA